MRRTTDALRTPQITELISPALLASEQPLSEAASETVFFARARIHAILEGTDDRLVAIVGPCSIHDYDAAIEYASRLARTRAALAADLVIVMRVYFEKPRTTIGWKGLINDPGLDGSFRINDGLRLAHRLLLDINDLGVPAGTEFLDLITPQYVADLVSWGAIGARTTESQVHRELASGVSCPVGFKNGTDGNVRIAAEAVKASRHAHHFLGVTKSGRSAIVTTSGNEDTHVILRGGRAPNYDAASVNAAAAELERAGVPQRIMIDASHGNSGKDPRRQVEVARDVAAQIAQGDARIFGVMIESNLVEGRQDLHAGKPLEFGKSVTDACLGWDDTEALLHDLARAVRARREARGELETSVRFAGELP